MRVTFVSYDDTPPYGGQGVVLAGMRDAVERRGLETQTISGRGDHRIPYPRVTGRAPLDLSLHLNRHPSLMLESKPDVLHANGGPGGVLLVRRLRVPLVMTAHHTYPQAHPRTSLHRLPAPLEAISYRRAAMVLCVSESTAAAVRAMRVPAARVEVLPPGVAIPDHAGAHEEGRVLFVGRLEENKGVLDAVAVMRSLVREVADARGVIVGGGTQLAAVRAAVAHEPRIEVLGPLDAAATQREYARASLLLMPSRYEGLGLTALEAQASGTPVAGYDVDGVRHAVRDGGVLVPPRDVTALQRAALELLRDPERLRHLGDAGRDFVRREHGWDRVGARLVEVYAAVTGKG